MQSISDQGKRDAQACASAQPRSRSGPDGCPEGSTHVGGASGYSLVNWIWCHPRAPSGKTLVRASGWVAPVASVARTVALCSPAGPSKRSDHCRHRSMPASTARSASCQGPSSILTSTLSMPRCCAQATPAMTGLSPGCVLERLRQVDPALGEDRAVGGPLALGPVGRALRVRRELDPLEPLGVGHEAEQARHDHPGGVAAGVGQRLAVQTDGDHGVAAVADGLDRASRRCSRSRASRSRPGRRPACTPTRSRIALNGHAEPAAAADVRAADLVGDAGEGDVALDQRHGQQVVVGEGDRVVDHAVDRQAPARRVDLRGDQADVDAVEAVDRGGEGGHAGDLRAGGQRRGRRGRCGQGGPAASGGSRRCGPGRRRMPPPPASAATTAVRPRVATKPRRPKPPVRGAVGVSVRPGIATGARTTRGARGARGPEAGDDDEQGGDPGDAGDDRRDRVERRRRGRPRVRGADDAQQGDPGEGDAAVGPRDQPEDGGEDEEGDADRADEDGLVVVAEQPDGERLGRGRRGVDQGGADGDDRRGRRRDEGGDEVADPDGDTGGHDPGGRPQRAARHPPRRRRVGTWTREDGGCGHAASSSCRAAQIGRPRRGRRPPGVPVVLAPAGRRVRAY